MIIFASSLERLQGFYELFWTSKPWFMVELACFYLQGFPLWNELVSKSLHPNWAWWLLINETNPHHELAQVLWEHICISAWLMELAHCWCCSRIGNAAGHQIHQINYLNHISIAKDLISWNTMWMFLKMCRLAAVSLHISSFSHVRAAMLKPRRTSWVAALALMICGCRL